MELVTSYNAVKKDPEKIIQLCKSYKQKHNKEYYYQVRSNINSNDPLEITARFLYLNQHSFRGIYRVNKHDQLQISCSSRKYSPSNNFATILYQCNRLLQDTIISAGDFSFIEPQTGDFVYFDPPYHKYGETFYTKLPFSEHDQIRLKEFAKELTTKGVKIMIYVNSG